MVVEVVGLAVWTGNLDVSVAADRSNWLKSDRSNWVKSIIVLPGTRGSGTSCSGTSQNGDCW